MSSDTIYMGAGHDMVKDDGISIIFTAFHHA